MLTAFWEMGYEEGDTLYLCENKANLPCGPDSGHSPPRGIATGLFCQTKLMGRQTGERRPPRERGRACETKPISGAVERQTSLEEVDRGGSLW
jgi:hypothetical protein